MSDLEKIIQQLQEEQRLSSMLQSELHSILEKALQLSKKVKTGKQASLLQSDLLKIRLLLLDRRLASVQFISILSSMKSDLIDASDLKTS